MNITYDRDREIAIITVDNPPVNALGPGVPEGIADGVERALAERDVEAIVLIGAGRTFIAGADIKEFGKITSGEQQPTGALHRLLSILEDSVKPVVCAIHGTALGGGLEIAMACHYRVAVASAQVGQPEVKIGLIPGAGGTQRLPRLAGIALAAELCATGRMVGAAEALEAGIIDRIVEGELLAGAVAFARECRSNHPRKTREIEDRLGDAEANRKALEALRARIARKSYGQIAPAKAIEAVELAATLPFFEAIERERELFMECLLSPQSRALIHVFFGEREVGRVPGIDRATPRRTIETAAVIGAGTMGGGIAMSYANAGIPVTLKEVDAETLERGVARIRKTYMASVERGRLAESDVERRMALIRPVTELDVVAEADIVVEAVFESMELKKKVFAELDGVAKPTAILATNTSTLDIDEIASATSRPESVIGHHFFSPANVMKLLEIVRGKATSDEVIATSLGLARRLGKIGVLAGNCFGFIGNRMFGPYMQEAQFLVEEGASPRAVDRALREFGMAMGPLEVADLAGIDVGWRIRQERKHLVAEGARQPVVADALYELGRYGQKTGAGWYRYEDGRKPLPDPEVDELIERRAAEAGIERRAIGDEEMVDRTIGALVDEGRRVLEEGIALRAVDIDIVYVYGYGFPAWRGGPMFWAESAARSE